MGRVLPRDLETQEGSSALLTRLGAENIAILGEIEDALALPYIQGQPRLDAIIASLPNRGPLSRAFVPALGKIHHSKTRVMTQLAMLQTALAVLQHKSANGELPDSLAGVPSAIPTDPFTDGKPFTYDLASKGFTLTSKGTIQPANPDALALEIIPPK